MAEKVCDIFEHCRTVDLAMQQQAYARHDAHNNAMNLLSIYADVLVDNR